jgi:hypothetical protein
MTVSMGVALGCGGGGGGVAPFGGGVVGGPPTGTAGTPVAGGWGTVVVVLVVLEVVVVGFAGLVVVVAFGTVVVVLDAVAASTAALDPVGVKPPVADVDAEAAAGAPRAPAIAATQTAAATRRTDNTGSFNSLGFEAMGGTPARPRRPARGYQRRGWRCRPRG